MRVRFVFVILQSMNELLVEYQRLVTTLGEVTARCAALEQIEVTAARAHAADKASWAARLAEAEAAVAHAWQRSLDVERERERLANELEVAARRHGADRQELNRSLEAVRRAEGAVASSVAEAESLRTAFASSQAAVAAAQEEARRAQVETQRIEVTADTARAEAEQLRAELDSVRTSEREARSRLEVALARTSAELQEARGQAQEAERARAAATAEVETLASALTRTQTALQTLEEETRRSGAEMERLRSAEQMARVEVDKLRNELQDGKLLVSKADQELASLRARLGGTSRTATGQPRGSRRDIEGSMGA